MFLQVPWEVDAADAKPRPEKYCLELEPVPSLKVLSHLGSGDKIAYCLLLPPSGYMSVLHHWQAEVGSV